MRFPFVPLLLLALPFLEIAGFVVVGSHIGVLWTLALVILAGVLGAVLLRVQGFGSMARIRTELAAGRDPSQELANTVMILVAGVLLLIPGFITDIFGLLLFLPPVRQLAWRFLSRRITVTTGGFGGFGSAGSRSGPGSGSGRDRTIDLDSDEYSHEPGKKPDNESPTRGDSPWKRIDSD